MKRMKTAVIGALLGVGLVIGYAYGTMHGQGAGAAGAASMKASDVIDKAVNDANGQKVGMVSDLVFGGQGQIAYVIMSPDKSLTEETYKMIPIPWQAVESQNEEALSVAVDSERLKNAPSFTENEWSQLSSSDWHNEVRGYYGMEPHEMKMQHHEKMKEMHEKMKEKRGY